MKQIIILLVFSIFIQSFSCLNLPSFRGPLHASCQIKWNWPKIDCNKVQNAILNQISLWTTDENCKNGGEKCLYKLKSQSPGLIKATHTTPVKNYVDDLTFTFKQNGADCEVDGSSSSETWYAVLDFGTNYCNLHNLITGASLDKLPGYTEKTDDSVCTQYSSANCEIY